ncbi:hypothetical protein Sjap_003651 [Stephania japonica]|uniref:Glycosyltransferase n=1 Tax=Stephania japonica TaxID=461633 RepID=A0AAP0KP75_9MAGN
MDTPFSTIPPGFVDSVPELRFIELVPPDSPSLKDSLLTTIAAMCEFMDTYKPLAKRTISQLATELSSNSVSIAALVFDMFTTNFMGVANDLGLPSYLFYASGAALLGLVLRLPVLDTEIDSDFTDHKPGELAIPSFKSLVPIVSFPSLLWRRDEEYKWLLYHARRMRDAKGIIVNSFYELEPYAIDSFTSGDHPRVHSVGPIVDSTSRVGQITGSNGSKDKTHDDIVKWLDKQPPRLVVFLCFGSEGTFDVTQAKEIANGLERSGYPFLWSVRPRDGSTRLEALVPDGFMERTAKRGMVVGGWVPQVAVLGHRSVGCFVSHCGWNSTLESVWFGVPILTWPMYAEQHLNTFLIVKELGLGVELKGYWRVGEDDLVTADEVERGVRSVMEGECHEEVKKRVEEMKEKSRRAIVEGGSSFVTIESLLEELIGKN